MPQGPNHKRRRDVIITLSVSCFSFLTLVVAACMIIRPQVFQHPGWGLSYFGGQKDTMLPYYFGLAVVAGCDARIAWLLKGTAKRWRPVRWAFMTAAALVVGIAVTSPQSNPVLYWGHQATAMALAAVILATNVWLILQPETNWIDYLAVAFTLVGIVIVRLSGDDLHILHASYWGEVLVYLAALFTLGRAALEVVEPVATGNS